MKCIHEPVVLAVARLPKYAGVQPLVGVAKGAIGKIGGAAVAVGPFAVFRVERLHGGLDVFDVILGLGDFRLLQGELDGREKQRRQYANDANDSEQFDQGECGRGSVFLVSVHILPQRLQFVMSSFAPSSFVPLGPYDHRSKVARLFAKCILSTVCGMLVW